VTVKAPKEKTAKVKTVKAPKSKSKKANSSPVVVRESARMRGAVVLFTGFRSQELERAVLSHGAMVADNFNKTVTLLVIKDASVDNAKTQKAATMGVKVVTAEQLKAMV
jgi:NAD-dependent DNA ligase